MDKQKEKQLGLYDKYIVRRADREDRAGYKHEACIYVVLDVTHDRNAGPALRAYADAVDKDGYEALAGDLHRLAGENEAMASRARGEIQL